MLYPVYPSLGIAALTFAASAAVIVKLTVASTSELKPSPLIPVITIVAVPAFTFLVRDFTVYLVGAITLPSTTTSNSGLIAAPV